MCLHMVLKLALIHPPSQEEADENGLPPALVCSFLGRFEYHMKTHTGLPHLPARNPWFAVRLLFANYEGTWTTCASILQLLLSRGHGSTVQEVPVVEALFDPNSGRVHGMKNARTISFLHWTRGIGPYFSLTMFSFPVTYSIINLYLCSLTLTIILTTPSSSSLCSYWRGASGFSTAWREAATLGRNGTLLRLMIPLV